MYLKRALKYCALDLAVNILRDADADSFLDKSQGKVEILCDFGMKYFDFRIKMFEN